MKKIKKLIPECKRHNPKSKELSYIGWFEYADEQIKKGIKQTQCKICKRYYFEDEF